MRSIIPLVAVFGMASAQALSSISDGQVQAPTATTAMSLYSTPPAYSSTMTSSAPAATGSLSCEEQENMCRTAPDANQAYCSSQRCSCDAGKPYCAGYSGASSAGMESSSMAASASSLIAVTTVTGTAPPSSTSTESCEAQENACRIAPDANQAFCSAQRCGCDAGKPYCIGYSSSSSQIVDSITATSVGTVVGGGGGAATATGTAPSTATSSISCEAQEDACRTAPDANEAFCSAQRCGCDAGKPYCAGYGGSSSSEILATVTASTVATVVGGGGGATATGSGPSTATSSISCEAQEDACRTAPDANQAFCSAQRCSCDAGKPYCAGYSGSSSAILATGTATITLTGTPTPTAASSLTCDEQENMCRTAPDANQAYCSSQRCACDAEPAYCTPASAASSGMMMTTPVSMSLGTSPTSAPSVTPYTGAAAVPTRAAGAFGAAIMGAAAYILI